MSDTVAGALARAALASGKVRIGAVIVLCLILVAMFASWIAPHDPQAQDLLNTLTPPMWDADGSATFPLGTDSLGRDILSRAIYGSQVALIVAISAATGALVLGGLLALVAGYFGGKIDWLITQAVDLWMSFPPVVLSLLLMVGLGIGLRNVILSIVLVDWTRFCRVARSEIIVVRRRDYVTAARLIGFGHFRTVALEIFPAVLPLLITLFSLEMGIAIVVEAILSFVGLSVGSEVTAWGVMIADGRSYVNQAPWALITPVIAIIVAVLGFNLLGDGLREALDLRLRSERA